LTSVFIFGAQGDLYAIIRLFVGQKGFQMHFDARIWIPTLIIWGIHGNYWIITIKADFTLLKVVKKSQVMM